jgi:hypothetical protein
MSSRPMLRTNNSPAPGTEPTSAFSAVTPRLAKPYPNPSRCSRGLDASSLDDGTPGRDTLGLQMEEVSRARA